MNEQLTQLDSMLSKTAALIAGVGSEKYSLATPCGEFDVEALLEHMAVWIQVFDSAVNDRPLGFDPNSVRVGDAGAEVFARSATSIIDGLAERGSDRPMTMTTDPIPGVLVLNMLLMEYIGHGWDLCRATGSAVPYSDDEAVVALAAAEAIIEDQYRGTGMFDQKVDVGLQATPVEKLMGFLGRDPHWAAPSE